MGKESPNPIVEFFELVGGCLLAPFLFVAFVAWGLWDAVTGSDIHPDDKSRPFHKQRVRSGHPYWNTGYHDERWKAWIWLAMHLWPLWIALVWALWKYG
jgi:hypothetical protein